MQIALDLSLIRGLKAPELRLSAGRALMARVVELGPPGRGLLSIAGALIEAELPEHVRAGQELRLLVHHVTAERVVLRLGDQPQQAPLLPLPSVPLPGGGTVSIQERDAQRPEQTGGETHSLTIRYDTQSLGRLDLRFELAHGALRVIVQAAPGEALQAAQEQAGELQAALNQSLDRPATVTVAPRREPLDVYA